MAASGTAACVAIATAGVSPAAGFGRQGTPRMPSKNARPARCRSGNRQNLRAGPTEPSGLPAT
eukprot:7945036-Lingulodinium_polyedra.AAC.1